MSLRNRQRLERLGPGLTLEQRISAVVESYRRTGRADRRLFEDVPEEQRKDFWYRVRLLRVTHELLGRYLGYMEVLIGQLELGYGWLATCHLRAAEAARMLCFLEWHTTEPVTESEYAARVVEVRASLWPVGELAEWLVIADDDESEDDDAARAAHEGRLRELVAEGVLVGTVTEDGLCVACGAFCDWSGQALPLGGEEGALHIVPDRDADAARAEREERHALLVGLKREMAAVDFTAGRDHAATDLERVPRVLFDRVVGGLAERWKELRLGELAVDAIAAELGHDPLQPDTRALLEGCRARLLTIHAGMREWGDAVELPEPEDSDLDWFLERLDAETMR